MDSRDEILLGVETYGSGYVWLRLPTEIEIAEGASVDDLVIYVTGNGPACNAVIHAADLLEALKERLEGSQNG